MTTVKNNASVEVTKQSVNDEKGKLVRHMYYMKLETEKGKMKINIGEKTFNDINNLTNETTGSKVEVKK